VTKTLIRGGCVLTLGPRTQNFTEADVLIEDGRIAEIGERLRARDATQVDAVDTIVMPGFVDTHRHVWKSLSRNVGDWPTGRGPEHGGEDVYAATLIGLLGAAEAGITTVVDWSDAGSGPAVADAALQAHIDSGLRSVLVLPSLDSFRRIHESGNSGMTTIAFGARGPSEGWDIAKQLGARIHAHAGIDDDRAVAVSAIGERLGPDVTLVHCSKLDDAELDAVSAAGAKVSLTPSSEMADGLGTPPIQRIIDRRLRPGLGINDERAAPGDMFAQMRATISLQHATYFDLKLAGKAGLPNLLTTREVIRFGTIDGANAVGLGTVTGSLQVGKRADLILLRTDRPNIVPVNDPIGAVVWGMDTSNVDWVFADGQVLMQAGSLTADVARARDLATAARARLAGDPGQLVGSSPGDLT
jgi:cytosine/adenosine deaminase-related metal-dependent hydrolase